MRTITYHALRNVPGRGIEEIRCTRPPASEGGSYRNEVVEHVRYWPDTRKGEREAIASIAATNCAMPRPTWAA